VPHAGWGFSGQLAARTLAHLSPHPNTVVIAGGHLRPEDPVLVSAAEGQRTPLGRTETDAELLDELWERFHSRDIEGLDNSVDALVPMVQHMYPEARILLMRVPPAAVAEHVGAALADYADRVAYPIAVVGSTDLTHYGPNFGFTPQGRGEAAHAWATEHNDARFLNAMRRMDTEGGLAHALEHHSACSPGGAVAAMTFARLQGARMGEVIGHYSSYDIRPDDSFVGYGGIVFF